MSDKKTGLYLNGKYLGKPPLDEMPVIAKTGDTLEIVGAHFENGCGRWLTDEQRKEAFPMTHPDSREAEITQGDRIARAKESNAERSKRMKNRNAALSAQAERVKALEAENAQLRGQGECICAKCGIRHGGNSTGADF
jgi:hypothetical protein